MKYYVDAKAALNGDGSKTYPFRKINDAAAIAIAGKGLGSDILFGDTMW